MNHPARRQRAPFFVYLGAVLAIAMIARSGTVRAQETKPAGATRAELGHGAHGAGRLDGPGRGVP